MRVVDKENVLKLDMLQSLAASQRAISKIMTNIADVTAISEHAAHHVATNIEVIAKYQRVLVEKMGSLAVKQSSRGTGGKPWLHDRVKIAVRK